MNRKDFIKTGLAGAAAMAFAGSPLLTSCASPAKQPKNDTPLRLSFQKGKALGETYAEKFDYMESLGIVGYEPGGKELINNFDELSKALEGRDIKVSAICAGFDGFILAEDPAVKGAFDSSMREIVEAAGAIGSTGVIMVPAFNHQKPCMPHNQETRDFLCEQMHELGEFALSKGTTVILEPLNRNEAFYLRLVADAAAICRDSQSEGVKCLGDFWHMKEETSDYGALMSAGKYLQHMHIASRGRRLNPGEDGELDNYIDGFRALKEMNYPFYVTFECGTKGDPAVTTPAAVELLRAQWEQA